MANDNKKAVPRESADGEAEKYLALQMSLKDKSRFSNILLTVLTMGFVFVFAALFWILPKRDFSPEENRALAESLGLKQAPTLVCGDAKFAGVAGVKDFLAQKEAKVHA